MVEKILGNLPIWITNWGPGLIIALVMLYGLYTLILRLGRDVGMKIVDALEKPSIALNNQAQSIDRLTLSIQEYVSRDKVEHREIIVLQKIVLEKIDNLYLQGEKDVRTQKREI